MRFTGVLVRLDEPSTKAPNGSNGHRILLPADVARKRLGTLIGMGLNYAPSLKQHAQRRKVGSIQKAWIEGKDLKVSGVVWKHDFPEATRDLKQPGLGMSMELGDVEVADEGASVWELKDLCFLGATILYQDAAAYHKTRAIAAKADERRNNMQKKKTAAGSDNAQLLELAASASVKAVTAALGPVLAQQTKILAGLSARIDGIEASLAEEESVLLEAAEADKEMCGKCGKAHGATEACAMKAESGDEDTADEEDNEEEMESAIDTGDLTEMGPDTEEDADADDTPGKFGKGARNKGHKTTSEDKVGKTVASSRIAAAQARERKLQEQIRTLQANQTVLEKRIRAQQKQVSAATDRMARRSLDAQTLQLLAKGGMDGREMLASGQVLRVAEVDAILEASGLRLSPVDRMAAKNRLIQAGLMEQGIVSRG